MIRFSHFTQKKENLKVLNLATKATYLIIFNYMYLWFTPMTLILQKPGFPVDMISAFNQWLNRLSHKPQKYLWV